MSVTDESSRGIESPGSPGTGVEKLVAKSAIYIVGMGTAPDLHDTSAVILTMGDWPGRTDTNEKLMALGSSMVFYTMALDYPTVFAQLKRFYAADTPLAVVCNAGDPDHRFSAHAF